MDWIKRVRIVVAVVLLGITLCVWAWVIGVGAAHAQKPETGLKRDNSNVLKWSNSANFPEPLFILREKSGWEIGPGLWQQIESHCVAVLNEAHTEAIPTGNLMPTTPIYQREIDKDGKEIVRMPELTLKLRCTAEQEKK